MRTHIIVSKTFENRNLPQIPTNQSHLSLKDIIDAFNIDINDKKYVFSMERKQGKNNCGKKDNLTEYYIGIVSEENPSETNESEAI